MNGTNYADLILWTATGALLLYGVPMWGYLRWQRKDRRK